MTALAFLAAVAAVLANSAASLLESAGIRQAPVGRAAWRQPRYAVGIAVDGVGWVLSVAALRVLPVVAVQSVLAGVLPVTVLASRGGDPRRLSRQELVASALVLGGLVLVAAAAAPGRPERLPAAAHAVLLGAAVVVLAALVPVLRAGRPLLMAAAAGVAYGGVALSVRAVHIASSPWTSVLDLLAEPLAYAVLAFGAAGTVLLAAAMRHGTVGAVVGVLSVTEVVAPGLVGLALLGDRVRPGWVAPLVVGWLLTVTGVVVLARAPARHPAQPRG
jgi:drug/metabolite transporter (DMT)-like permease